MQFSEFNLSEEFVNNLTKLGFIETTPIQEASIEYILNKNDVIAKAKTGSGKTLAFGIGVVNSLDLDRLVPQALIITPTRELANQVASDLKEIAKYQQNIKITTLIGGEPLSRQTASLKNGSHILVATPGRLLDHLEKEILTLKTIHTLVLDEADKMLDMGFLDDVKKVIRNMSSMRQTMLFSATFDDDILKLSKEIQKNSITIEIDNIVDKLEEYYLIFDDKYISLKQILTHFMPQKAVIFCTTKVDVVALADRLYDDGYSVVDLQGDLDQYSRDENLIRFSNGSANILVATDLASRGLDIQGVDLVVNYDFPKNNTQYTHRIGRTGRAGKSGIAVSLLRRAHESLKELKLDKQSINPYSSAMETLIIKKYPKNKIRAGDIVGTITKTKEVNGDNIGDINITPNYAYVAIHKDKVELAFKILQNNKIKGDKFKIYRFE